MTANDAIAAGFLPIVCGHNIAVFVPPWYVEDGAPTVKCPPLWTWPKVRGWLEDAAEREERK
jgi:hypothetical protein